MLSILFMCIYICIWMYRFDRKGGVAIFFLMLGVRIQPRIRSLNVLYNISAAEQDAFLAVS